MTDRSTRIAFLGLGTMGLPMARRLLEAGFDTTVWNRTASKAAELHALGAEAADTPASAARGRDLVFVMVSDTGDVEQVVFGPEGVATGLGAGSLLIDMSTISPAATRSFAARLEQAGSHWLDAPVSGGSEGAERGTLSIMVGGRAQDLARARPALEVLGSTITHVGATGAGQVTKAINQVVIAGTYAAVAEGVALGLRSGIDMKAALQAVAGGAAGSWILDNRAGNMVRNSYPLGFKVELHRKDLGIALAEARELGVPLTVTALVEQWETGLVSQGHGSDDVSAIARIVRGLAGLPDEAG